MGKLYVVPTPVGNLEDITLRAIRVLKEVDSVLAEDTRTSGFLLRHLGIEKKMQPFHKFNEHKALEQLVERLRLGETLALVSDAGTPSISDPGFLLVRACGDADIPVECLPGPTSFVPALVQSGLPCERFCFEGFLPVKKGRQKRLQELAAETRTLILFESPFRVIRTLEEMIGIMGPDRKACLCRELSKKFEETIRGTLQEIKDILQQRDALKGEMVLMVSGRDRKSEKTSDES
jgi:16S rRNA (cytidine1402-2'-O)-methyltransferase